MRDNSPPIPDRHHIAFIVHKFRASGGAEQMGLIMLDAFLALGTRLTVVARNLRGEARGFEFARCDPFYLGRNGRLKGFARRACRISNRLQPELVVSQEHLPCADVYRAGGGVLIEELAQLARIRGRVKNLYDRMIRFHRSRLALERSMYESGRLRAVICNSAMVRDDILRHFSIPAERLHVIENATDLAHFQRPDQAHEQATSLRTRFDIPESATILLYVGSGFERKGVATAIRALTDASAQAHLIIVGRDHRMWRYRRLVRSLGLGRRVHFAGVQPDVRPFYWGADALIHPALYEPYGLVVLEAMAAGLPVLTSTACGAGRSLVREGENGWLVEALDVPGWHRAIDALDYRRQQGGYDEMKAAARRSAEERGDTQRLQRQVADLCRQLLAKV